MWRMKTLGLLLLPTRRLIKWSLVPHHICFLEAAKVLIRKYFVIFHKSGVLFWKAHGTPVWKLRNRPSSTENEKRRLQLDSIISWATWTQFDWVHRKDLWNSSCNYSTVGKCKSSDPVMNNIQSLQCYGNECAVGCKEGFEKVGEDLMFCDGESWNVTQPQCAPMCTDNVSIINFVICFSDSCIWFKCNNETE